MKRLFGILCLLAAQPLLAEEAPPQYQDQGLMQTMILIGIALVFFYFILWRPEQKRRKQVEAQRDAMKKGDRVTAMGIIGTVDRVGEHTVILKMVDGAKVEFLKAAVTDVLSENEEEKK